MKIFFITTNRHKFKEVKGILKEFKIELSRLDLEYEENQAATLEEVARDAAQKLANKLQKPVVLEDSGIFFEAYKNFPGTLTKFAFQTLGYKGLLKVLDGENRKAYFKTIAAFCEPSQEPVMFKGYMKGFITDKVYDEDVDAMPYDRIFIPEGKDKTISSMSLEEKNSFSQRAEAFRKFGKYICSQNDINLISTRK